MQPPRVSLRELSGKVNEPQSSPRPRPGRNTTMDGTVASISNEKTYRAPWIQDDATVAADGQYLCPSVCLALARNKSSFLRMRPSRTKARAFDEERADACPSAGRGEMRGLLALPHSRRS